MMNVGWATLAAALAVFAIAGLRGASSATNAHSFFHIDGMRRNVLSLGIADITLGTGLVYILTASSQLGLWMLVPPFGLAAGYYTLSKLYQGEVGKRAILSGNLLLAVRDWQISGEGSDGRRHFDLLVTLPLIFTYLLFVCYEVFASSQVIAAFVSPGSGLTMATLTGASILAVSGINSVSGGMQANWRNDRILAAGILLLVAVVALASFAGDVRSSQQTPLPPLTGPLAIMLILAFINAFATQIYSLLNAYNGSNFEKPEDAARSFVKVGLIVALLLGVVSLIGALRPLDLSGGLPAALGARLDSLPFPDSVNVMVKAITVFGMAAVVFSTCDTLMLALAYFIKRHLLNQNTDLQENGENQSLLADRLLVGALFFGIVPPLSAFYLFDPNLFTLLLAIAGAATVYAPFILLGALRIGHENAGNVRSFRRETKVFFGLFSVAGAAGAYFTANEPANLPILSLTAVILSIFLAVYFLFSSQRRI
jgi:hypothetical protein